jgi:hypothetical protein
MRFLALVLAVVLTAVLPIGASAASAQVTARPLIDQVRGRTVRVRVPTGVQSVTLERCTSARQQRWEVVATKSTGTKGGTVEFQLPQAVSRRFLRVKGSIAPVTTGSLAGAKLFLADPALAGGGGVFASFGVEKMGAGALALGSGTTADAAGTATREVAESDIWRVAGDRLYFFNELRGLQVFDITNPDDPALLGQLRAPGRGEQMYLLDATHVALLVRGSSYLNLAVRFTASGAASDANLGALVLVDVAQGRPVEVARVSYRGTLRESRRVGSVIYIVSDVWDGGTGSIEVTAFDVSEPAAPVKRDTLSIPGWGAAIHATDRFLFVVGHNDDWTRSVIDVIDTSSPTGVLARRGRIRTAGRVEDKFKMHLEGNVFTAVSAVQRRWNVADDDADGGAPSRTKIETFSLTNPDAPAALGSLVVGEGETVRATRFDDQRLYVVTFFQIDPLWVIDLTNPATPTLLGELEIPGFSTYIEPLGDRLVAIGRLDDQTAVALFDVSDPTHPVTLSQLPLGDGSSWSEANWDEKAFNVVPEENLIVVPFSGYESGTGYANRVQLLDLTRDALVKRGVIDHRFAARRTAVKGRRLLAISATDLVTVDLTNRDQPRVTSEVEIAWRVDRVFLAGSYLLQIGGSADVHDGQAQTLSVSTASAPDTVLTTVNLDAATVLGATVRDGRLYLAQRNPEWYSDLIYAPDRATNTGTTGTPAANPFILSVFDLTSLPALPRLARTESEVALGYTSELQAAWPADGVLVWVRQGARFSRFWDIMPIVRGAPNAGVITLNGGVFITRAETAITGITAPSAPPAAATGASSGSLRLSSSAAQSSAPWWGYSSAGVEAVVFDVSTPAAPVLAAKLNIRTGSTGEWSEAFAAPGKIYVSSVAYEDFVTIGEGDGTPVNAPSRRYRHFLKVVDLADPAHPVMGADINIPGRLIGVSNAGARLYTVGCRYEADGTPKHSRALHVSDFDGAAATFVDQLTLADYGAAYALDLDTVLVGVRASDGEPDRVEAWQLDGTAKFQRRSQTPVDDVSALGVVRGLLVVGSSYGARQLFDVTDAVHVRALGTFPAAPNYWYSNDLGKADGSPTRGLWQPLGNYGIGFVEFAP